MDSEMDKIISAVAWPATLLLNIATSLPPIGVVLSTIVSSLAIVHYSIVIIKAIRGKKEKQEEDD
jgi:uncharacterized membrane protein